ncbi:MAG TPA: stress response translation initiation inhibitor YciH [Nitrososphaera sp.]|nr:stress response translation initiation inhibitor YciH [Nitrososphaera sp.]
MSSSDHDPMDELIEELEKGETHIVVSKEIRKWNKPVTVITGLKDRPDAKEITKSFKTKIGTGGTFKNGQIELQGDHRDTVKDLLIKTGFSEDSIEVL